MVNKKQITKIEKQKRNNSRYNLFVDDEYFTSIHEDILVSQGLYKGKEITEIDFELILQQEEKQQAWRKALRYLSYRPRTTYEMEQYLIRKEFNIEQITEVLKKLEKENLLDDVSYARRYIEERINLKNKGKRLVKLELKNKGIHTTIIDEFLNNTSEEDEYHAAVTIVEKKINQYNKFSDLEKKRKIAGLLNRRGFSYDVINKVLSEYT